MQFNVSQLLQEPIGATRSFELQEDIAAIDDDLKPLGPLVGTLNALRTNSGILVSGELSTALEVPCRRCLIPMVMPVRFEIEESFRPLTEVQTGRYIHPDEFEGSTADLEDAALLINEQHILNLGEIIRQAIWLALPMVSNCNWEEPDDCPHFKEHIDELEGLELGPGEQHSRSEEEQVDPRWAALLALRSQLDDSD